MIKSKRFYMRQITWLVAFALVLSWSELAHAHVETGKAAGFASGFKHPWSGWDHVLAMIAVGIWGAQLGPPAMWLLPVVFPMVMAFGGFLGLIRIPLPGVEYGIAMSAVLLGGMVLGDVHSKNKAFLVFAAALIGTFAIFHGHAHGAEMDAGQSAMLYSIGFVVATGTLHACGILLGLIHRWPAGKLFLRAAGAAILLGGLYFLWEAFRGRDEGPAAKAAAMLVYLQGIV